MVGQGCTSLLLQLRHLHLIQPLYSVTHTPHRRIGHLTNSAIGQVSNLSLGQATSPGRLLDEGKVQLMEISQSPPDRGPTGTAMYSVHFVLGVVSLLSVVQQLEDSSPQRTPRSQRFFETLGVLCALCGKIQSVPFSNTQEGHYPQAALAQISYPPNGGGQIGQPSLVDR